MRKLSEATFCKNLKAIPDRQDCEDSLCFEGEMPKGVDAAALNRFVRVMQAEKPSDVSDISDDELLEMLSLLGGFASCMEVDNPYTNGTVLRKLRNTKGVRKRRIL